MSWPQPQTSIGSQHANTLLKVSFSSPRLYICCDAHCQQILQTFGRYLRPVISKVRNSVLSDIPTAHGGLGVRRVSSLANPAFPASWRALFPSRTTSCHCIPVPLTIPWPCGPRRLVHYLILCLTVDSSNPIMLSRRRQRFLAAQAQHSGDWLLTSMTSRYDQAIFLERIWLKFGMRIKSRGQ